MLLTLKSKELQSIENPDWDYARNKRSVLMTPSAEWVQSIYSCEFELNGKKWVVPNRDSSYEGLLVHQDGENWKFIDCIAVALQSQDGRFLPLVGVPTVKVTPWQVTYYYRTSNSHSDNYQQKEIHFFVSYYLNSVNSPELIAGEIEIGFSSQHLDDIEVIAVIQPFVDIRHMYSGANFYDYRKRIDGYSDEYKRIHLSHYNRTLTFYLPLEELLFFDSPEILNWHYKLGTASRTEIFNYQSQQNETKFISESKDIAAFFQLRCPLSKTQKSIKIFFACGLENRSVQFFLSELKKISQESKQKDRNQSQKIQETFPLAENLDFRDAIWARIIALIKFKTYIHLPDSQDYIKVPHAGAWWFKTPWYRDVFEGILNSFETLMQFPEEQENIKNIILLALKYQDDTKGLILNRIPEYKTLELSYSSSDATLLCFITANAYIHQTKDLDFGLKILSCAKKTISCFQNAYTEGSIHTDGSPRLDEQSGLLLSTPHHSWIDTRAQTVEYAGWRMEGLPSRVSAKFVKDLYDETGNKEEVEKVLSSPLFFLPEINAQWIMMLKGIIKNIDFILAQDIYAKLEVEGIKKTQELAKSILSRAKTNFKNKFWNNDIGFLFNLVYANGKIKDEMECETAITAAGMLGEEIFTSEELDSIWNWTKKKLLVHRRLVEYGEEILPFGIIATNADMRIFYGDKEYHGDVVWLRSTPYLIKLLNLLKQEKIIKEILINTLDHQMTEGAIFYNQEVLSRPFGNNYRPDNYTCNNPVPVKNPIQFWSQWCDELMN